MRWRMPFALHAPDATPPAEVMGPSPEVQRSRPRQALMRAWADALLRKGLRLTVRFRRGPRLAGRGRRDLYDTSPVHLSAEETRRVEEILSRRLVS